MVAHRALAAMDADSSRRTLNGTNPNLARISIMDLADTKVKNGLGFGI
jgi:hypothetical protein